MSSQESFGWVLLTAGLVLASAGLVWLLLGSFWPSDLTRGRLPGNIRLEGRNFRVSIPLATCVLLSLLLTLLFRLLRG